MYVCMHVFVNVCMLVLGVKSVQKLEVAESVKEKAHAVVAVG